MRNRRVVIAVLLAVAAQSSARAVRAQANPLKLANPAADTSPPSASTAPVQVGADRVPDPDIEQMLRAVFAEVEELDEVRVRVRAGVVHLEGTAESDEAEDRAVALAQRIEGVLYVDDDLVRPEDAQKQIAPALGRAKERLTTLANKLPLLALAALLVVIGYGLSRVMRGRSTGGLRSRNPLVRGLYRQIASAAVLVTTLVLALELLQATALVSAVLGAAGVLGLALGLALRDIAENYLSSILLSLRRPFDPSDLVKIGEHEGRVMRLTTRDTTLMTLEGNSVRLPSSTVFKSVIVNYTRNALRQLIIPVGVASHQNLLDVQRVGLQGLGKTPGVEQEPPPFARVEGFGASYMEVSFFAWVDQRKSDWWKVRSEAVRHLKGAFEQAGIDLPAPSLRIEAAPGSDDTGRAADQKMQASSPEDLTKQAHEVGQDDHLQRQMADDQARSDEEDLLCDPPQVGSEQADGDRRP